MAETPESIKPKNTGGRPPGRGNNATVNAREAIARFVDGNAPRLQAWLDEIAIKDGPAAAFRCFADIVEYHVPKLARTEVVGPGGTPLQLGMAQLRGLSDAELQVMAALLDKAALPQITYDQEAEIVPDPVMIPLESKE